MKGLNSNLTDIPEPFSRNIQQDNIDREAKTVDTQSEMRTMKTKQNDLLFLLLIMIIFYDNRF